jgi:pimeloyl-ACP methyl ester carboxylesterase
VLVGHSMGCLYADLFARLYPEETRAVLLLAPTHAADPETLKRKESPFGRAIARLLQVPEGEISANLHGELAAIDDTLRQLADAGPFPDVPVAMVAGEEGHFPQLTDPDGVLRELSLLLARA